MALQYPDVLAYQSHIGFDYQPVPSPNLGQGGPSVRVLQTISLPLSSAPTATGWSDRCRAGFAPARDWRLFTAHCRIRVKLGRRLAPVHRL